MNRQSVVICLFAGVFLMGPDRKGQGAEAATPDPKLQPLAKFVGGEWVMHGKWSNGTELHARAVYEWGLGGKIVRARTYTGMGSDELQRYEGVMAWHPERKCLYEVSFAVDGAISEFRIDSPEEGTIEIGFNPLDPAKPGKVRQTLKLLDDNRHSWKVELKTDSGWELLIDAVWERKPERK